MTTRALAGRRPELLGTLLLYVLPLLLTVAFLAHVGLWLLAGALLAVEVVMAGTVAAVRRRPARPSTPRDGSAVLLALGAGVVLVALALVAVVSLAG